MNQVKQTVVALGVLAMLAGCTGDDSTVSSSSNGYEVSSGLAQKGPLLRGSSVTVNELNTSTLQPSGKSYTFEVLDDLGTFRPSNITFSSAYLENTALGYYFNELTGQKSSDMVYLRGLSYLPTDKAVNLNVLSSFVKNRVKNLVTTKPIKSYLAARPQAERELLGAFYIYNAVDLMPGTTVGSVIQPKTFMELDLSKKRAGDQILAAISGMVAQIGQTGSGVNYFLNQVETDLADDGLINNSPNFPVSVQQQLSDAAKSTDFGAVAANLNAFYKTNYTATDLSQWVDTSGGVDKVINKYKFSASNVPVGTESKSPEYVAGSEDAGQCFSVSAGKLYRNGVAVATGTVKAVKGDKFVIGLTPGATDTTLGSFIQRSMSVNGVCQNVVPSVKNTRLQKYTVESINVAIASFRSGSGVFVAVLSDGSLWTWGDNYGGNLNNSSAAAFQATPSRVLNGDDYMDAVVQWDNWAIKRDGNLYGFGNVCWNSDTSSYYMCPRTGPILVDADNSYVKLFSSGNQGALALKADGTLWAWGEAVRTFSSPYQPVAKPVQVGSDFARISVGGRFNYPAIAEDFVSHYLGFKRDGRLVAGGGNFRCQAGVGAPSVNSFIVTQEANLGNGFIDASAGFGFSLVVKSDNSLWGWGSIVGGVLGNGDDLSNFSPLDISRNFTCSLNKILDGVISVQAGYTSAVALKTDGTIWGWGLDSSRPAVAHAPRKIGDGFIEVSMTNTAILARKVDGTLWQWEAWDGDARQVFFVP